MASPFGMQDLEKLKSFTNLVAANPTILNTPQLKFVKDFIESFGGTVPSGEFKMPAGGKCPFGGDSGGTKESPKPEQADIEPEEAEMESDPESEIELDMEGVIEPDEIGEQPMGDSTKTPTEDEIDQASELRSQAAAAYSEQKFQEAIALYTKAIELNPGNALFHAKRGQAFLKLKKPNACIRDCDKALEINCDSAAAYKFRGRAHRLLGNWELAAKDLRQACKLDFDEETDEWLREVTPNAKKIEQHRIKQERRELERKRRAQEQARRKARAEQQRQQQQRSSAAGEAGGAADGLGGLNMDDILSGMRDPEVASVLQDIIKNPANISKYKSNPKIAKLIDVFQNMSANGGGMPGFPGNFAFPGATPGGGPTPTATATATAMDEDVAGTPEPAQSEPKAEPKKKSFVDDELD